ncbi:MAG: hypothetical protein M4579_006294 [Chaenotheca gracillima]|nr:MAG: hypothetical protein M4579_006294 [Chaenotheca gracillima]
MGLHTSLLGNGSSARLLSDDGTGSASLAQMPVNLLESFIPGYSVISRYLLEAFGFDITILVSIAFLAFGIGTATTYIFRYVSDFFQEWFMSTIDVPSDDAIYDHMMRWLGDQQMSKNSRSLRAVTANGKAWDDEEFSDDEEDDDWDSNKLLDFSNFDAKTPPRYEPALGEHYFWHRGTFFILKRSMRQLMSTAWGSTQLTENETLTLTCVGRSTQPIKNLLELARDRFLEKERSMTVIRRPGPKETRAWSGRGMWMRVATRPSRPMDTVVLDHEQKAVLLADINEYLHPSTPRWYATRGIPYRRGYLFAGPPGTGKTSLSFALAGIFGLDIFVISLLDPTLTEEDLGMLFNNLPRRCIVLLEDIDSAGLKRIEAPEEPKSEPTDEKAVPAPEWGLVDVAKALKSAKSDDNDGKAKKRISLSGLLNAIDGVASHEGRVLVMTTNHPDKLDEALVRPGRIDMRIDFSLASQTQIKEIFVRMYASDDVSPLHLKIDNTTPTTSTTKAPSPNLTLATSTSDAEVRSSSSTSVASSAATSPAISHPSTGFSTPASTPTIPPSFPLPPNKTIKTRFRTKASSTSLSLAEIRTIAGSFASALPPGKFTPAEVQGFLLVRKKDPRGALTDVGAWRDALLEAKARKGKVIGRV